MSDRTLEPFTPAEWASEPDMLDGYINLDTGAIDVRLGAYTGEEATHRRYLAAKLLHGQPFGFTWEDVDAIVRVWRALSGDDPDEPRILDIAARIAALLPPREDQP
jgi:hypothetical protein